MPNFDQTGPHGMGSLTGRGLGPCSRGMGRGLGRGMGCGRGFGRAVRNTTSESTDDKIASLQAYLNTLKEEIDHVAKELSDVKKSE